MVTFVARAALLFQVPGELPPPPGTDGQTSDGSFNPWVIAAIVAGIIIGTVLLAWLLKPMVARRVGNDAIEAAKRAPERPRDPATPWMDRWAAPRPADAERVGMQPSDVELPNPEPAAPVESTAPVPTTEPPPTPIVAVERASSPERPVEPVVEVPASEPAVGKVESSEPISQRDMIDPLSEERGEVVSDATTSEIDQPSQQLAPVAPVEAVPSEDHFAPAVDESPLDVDAADLLAVTLLVRTLLERANDGRVKEGFALYSDAARERFREETGLSAEEFDAAFENIPAPPPDQQSELAGVTDLQRLSDGRLTAVVAYTEGGANPAPERYTFVQSSNGNWLIDEIGSV